MKRQLTMMWLVLGASVARAGNLPAPAARIHVFDSAPAAFSVAAEPGGLRWGFVTSAPLGVLHSSDVRDPAAPRLARWNVAGLLQASRGHESSGPPALSVRVDRGDGAGLTWWGVSRGGTRDPGEPEARLRLGAGRLQWLAGTRVEFAWITSSVLFRDDPRWFRTRTFRYSPSGDTFGFRDTTVTESADHSTFWHTAQGSVRWQHGLVAVGGIGGISLGEGVTARRWAQATVDLRVQPHLLLTASLGERPAASTAFHGRAQPHTMIGVEWAPWSPRGWPVAAQRPAALAWRSRTVAADHILVRVHGRDASRVEIAGDFTDWQPVALLPVRGHWWAGMLRVSPGLHRVQVRLDGGPWHAPPGLPRADDGPAGPAGTLIVGG